MTIDEILALLRAGFGRWDETGIAIDAAGHRAARLRMEVGARALRPGGTVSGPTMFLLADTAIYVAVLASVGPQALPIPEDAPLTATNPYGSTKLFGETTLYRQGGSGDAAAGDRAPAQQRRGVGPVQFPEGRPFAGGRPDHRQSPLRPGNLHPGVCRNAVGHEVHFSGSAVKFALMPA